jgi:uncharacterized repeat protein (TIGR03803 family)
MNKLLTTTAALALASAAFAGQAQAGAPLTVLHSFCLKTDCTDGAQPMGGLTSDGAGNYFGTTEGGGDANEGTVYKMSFDGTRWSVVRIHSFCATADCTDGAQPYGGVIVDTNGNLYGMTNSGGNSGNGGVIYELSPHGGKYTYSALYTLCSATNCADGQTPLYAELSYSGKASGALYDGTSPLYGTTSMGGSGSFAATGVVFSLTHKGKTWTQKVIYDFCSQTNCLDGGVPYAGVTVDGSGNLYGTNSAGGAYYSEDNGGTVFKLSLNGTRWKINVLHAFCAKQDGNGNCTDGSTPSAPPVLDASGNLFGTTVTGALGYGTVYEIPAGGKFALLHSFCVKNGCPDGALPGGRPLVLDAMGNLFGVATQGGSPTAQGGTVFELSGAKHVFSTIDVFKGTNGAQPFGGLMLDASGALFGTASAGGKANHGTLYSIKP